MTHVIRSLIRETLLLEEVYGAQATVYHGTRADPQVLISALLDDTFRPGEGSGSMYGKGLYTVYNLKGAKTNSGEYGDYVIKLKVNLYGYIIFDAGIAKKVYKAPLSIVEQAKELGLSKQIIEMLKEIATKTSYSITSDVALRASKFLLGVVKGIMFTGEHDGPVAVVYDPTTAVPIAWKNVRDKKWNKVDREKLKPSLKRSATGEWQEEKYEKSPLRILKKLKSLPLEERIVDGSLELNSKSITSLPDGLKVKGSLVLAGTMITSLPENLEVGGFLDLQGTRIKLLPNGLKVGNGLYLEDSLVQSIPEDAKIGGVLHAAGTSITSLPTGLKVVSLDIKWTKITSLPKGLEVEWSLNISGTRIYSLPEDLKVGYEILGFEGKRSSVPEHLRSKLNYSR